jgi:transketolase
MPTMRDAFFLRVFERAKQNPDIVVLTSDFSAPSFDRFRTGLPGQFINTGISEQNTMLVAAGLALSGKTVFVTSIAPFITMRCFEQTRLFAADMNLNIKIVAVGAGFSYNTAGPTHHSVEDIALMRTLPNMRILSPCCNSQVEAFADYCIEQKGPFYVRLDRMILDELYNGFSALKTNLGFSVLYDVVAITLLSTGYMVHTALKVAKNLQSKGFAVGLLDIYQLPVHETEFIDAIKKAKQLVVIEEHIKAGGLGSAICELLNDNNHLISVKRFAFDVSIGFYHRYGTRDHMHEECGLGMQQIQNYVEELKHE